MAAIAKNPAFAKKVGIKSSVGEEFLKADKGRKFGSGGMTTEQQKKYYAENARKGKEAEVKKDYEIFGSRGDAARKGMEEGRMDAMGTAYKKGGKVEKESKSEMKKEMAADKKQDVAMIKKALKEHDAQEHKGGKGTKISLKKGGMAMKETMGPRNMSKDVEAGSNKLTKFGESAVQKRGKTKGTNMGDAQMATVGPKEFGATKMAKGGMCMGGKPKKMAMGGSASKRADGIASKGKTKGTWC